MFSHFNSTNINYTLVPNIPDTITCKECASVKHVFTLFIK